MCADVERASRDFLVKVPSQQFRTVVVGNPTPRLRDHLAINLVGEALVTDKVVKEEHANERAKEDPYSYTQAETLPSEPSFPWAFPTLSLFCLRRLRTNLQFNL